jgi:hypothetical protein
METINYLLMDFESDEFSHDDIERLMKIRVSALPDNDRNEISQTLASIEGDLNDLISIGSPIYKVMSYLPSAYLDNSDDSVPSVVIKIGKTIQNIRILQNII